MTCRACCILASMLLICLTELWRWSFSLCFTHTNSFFILSHTQRHCHCHSLPLTRTRTHTHTHAHCAPSCCFHFLPLTFQTLLHKVLFPSVQTNNWFSVLCIHNKRSFIYFHVGCVVDETAAFAHSTDWNQNPNLFLMKSSCTVLPLCSSNRSTQLWILCICTDYHSGYNDDQCLHMVYASFSKCNMPAKWVTQRDLKLA